MELIFFFLMNSFVFVFVSCFCCFWGIGKGLFLVSVFHYLYLLGVWNACLLGL